MFSSDPHQPDPVECILRNAELRNALEPLQDESIESVDIARMTTHSENDFLESMLEWERAPMIPVAEWFDPVLTLPEADELSDDDVAKRLAKTIHSLYTKHIVLEFTDHLSDRELYALVSRDILPAYEKKLDRRKAYLHWDCANTSDDPDTWLRYYASEQEREVWAEETGKEPPPMADPPHRRRLPKAAM